AAVEKADAAIKDIRRLYGKVLTIETVKALPPDGARSYEQATKAEKDKLRTQMAQGVLRAAGGQGIAVLICRTPGFLEVEADPETLQRAFKPADRHQLGKLLLERFEAKQYDPGLLEGIAFVRTALQTNLGNLAQKPPTVAPADLAAGQQGRKALYPEGDGRSGPKAAEVGIGGSAPAGGSRKGGALGVSAPKVNPGETPTPESHPTGAPSLAVAPASSFNWMWVIWGVVIVLGIWLF